MSEGLSIDEENRLALDKVKYISVMSALTDTEGLNLKNIYMLTTFKTYQTSFRLVLHFLLILKCAFSVHSESLNFIPTMQCSILFCLDASDLH